MFLQIDGKYFFRCKSSWNFINNESDGLFRKKQLHGKVKIPKFYFCKIPTLVWELQLDLVRTLSNGNVLLIFFYLSKTVEYFDFLEDFFRMREFTAEKLSEIGLQICELINTPQYLPKIPSRSEISSVYDVRFSDCCPYLWRLDSEYGQKRTPKWELAN